MDPYLHSRLEDFFSTLRKRSIVQYLNCFESVSIDKIAQLYATSPVDMEKEIVTLIERKEIDMRIDGHHKVRYIPSYNVDSFGRGTCLIMIYVGKIEGK